MQWIGKVKLLKIACDENDEVQKKLANPFNCFRNPVIACHLLKILDPDQLQNRLPYRHLFMGSFIDGMAEDVNNKELNKEQ